MFFFLSILSFCFEQIENSLHEPLPAFNSLSTSSNTLNSQQNKHFHESTCSNQGEYTDKSQFNLNGCSSVIFENSIFNWKSNPESVIAITSLYEVRIQNCKFYSYSKNSTANLFTFKSTLLNIDNFTLDFTNLGNNLFTHAIFSLENSINTVSNLSFNLLNINFDDYGSIIRSQNFLLHIQNTQINNVKSNGQNSIILYKSNSDSNIPLIIDNSIFNQINYSQFEFNSQAPILISNCKFNAFDNSNFKISTNKDVQFKNVNFMNLQNDNLLNLSNWKYSDAIFDNCTFERINGRILTLDNQLETVTFHSCHFNNNQYDKEGCPCINSNHSNIVMNDCTFKNNTNYWRGTSLLLINSHFIISECHFINNKCNQNESKGGSIFISITESSIQQSDITRCSFMNNFCGNSGGSIYFSAFEQQINIEDCSFENCSSKQTGGAIASTTINKNELYFINCSFIKCSSTYGGALYFDENEFLEEFIIDCIFDSCFTINGSSIYSISNRIVLSNSTFLNQDNYVLNLKISDINVNECYFYNTTKIYIDCQSPVVISNSTFENELFAFDSNFKADLTILNNCTFKNIINGVSVSRFDNKSMDIINCSFLNGIGDTESGGINIIASNLILTIRSCVFKNCKTNNRGGAINCHHSKHLLIDNCLFSNNTGMNGGAIFIQQEEDITIQSNIFENNHALTYGGSIFLNFQEELGFENEKMYIDNCTFINSVCNDKGGAICSGNSFPSGESYNDGDLVILKCKFINCVANQGGGLYFQNGQPESEIYHHDEEKFVVGCYFENCNGIQSNSLGTCIYSLSYKLEINTTIFKDNDDGESFLYIKMDDDGIAPILYNNTFDNSARTIYIECKSILNISNCIFENDFNFQLKALFSLENLKTKGNILHNCTFQKSNHGILAFSFQNDLCSIFDHCTIQNIDGGAYGTPGIRVGGNSVISITNCNFINLSCQNHGAAIQCEYAAHCSISYNTFINNSAVRPDIDYQYDGYGGAIYVMQNDNITIKNNYFYNNTASYNSGGIFIQFQNKPEKMCIDNCTFVHCISLHHGGALTCGSISENKKDGELQITNCKFIDCVSKIGGAVYFPEGLEQKFIINCYFEGSTETSNGSCIYSQAENIRINQTSFKDEFENNQFIVLTAKATPIFYLCSFIYNSCNAFGINVDQLIFDNCNFTSQNKKNSALLIDNKFKSTKMEFLNCRFNDFHSNNSALTFDDTLLTSCLIKNCLFSSISANNGGVFSVYRSNLNLVISNTQFNDCSAKQFGGVLFSNSNLLLNLENCTFSNVNAGKNGAALYIEMKNQINVNSSFEFEKKENVSLIYLFGGDSNLKFVINGGCYTSLNRRNSDKSPDFIFMDSDASIEFKTNPCFSESFENSIYLKNPVPLDQVAFNCHECQPISPTSKPTIPPTLIPPTRSPQPTKSPTPIPTQTATVMPTITSSMTPTKTSSITSTKTSTLTSTVTSSMTSTTVITMTRSLSISESDIFSPSASEMPTNTDSGSGSKKKQNRKVLIGIVSAICCLIVVLAISLGIVIYCRKKRNHSRFNVFVGESEDEDNDVVKRFINSQSGSNQSLEVPLFSGDFSTHDSLIAKDDADDPFMKAYDDS